MNLVVKHKENNNKKVKREYEFLLVIIEINNTIIKKLIALETAINCSN